jgi:hypothetical protein
MWPALTECDIGKKHAQLRLEVANWTVTDIKCSNVSFRLVVFPSLQFGAARTNSSLPSCVMTD